MTLADYSMAAFALLNGGRTVAYLPQMMRVYRDPHGAAAVSLLTWSLFTASNAATVCYALTASNDSVMAIVFSLNTICCIAIVGLTASKRLGAARRTSLPRLIESLRQSQTFVERWTSAEAKSEYYGSPSARHRDEMIRQGLIS